MAIEFKQKCKPKMYPVCRKCGILVESREEGCIVHGNVYAAEGDYRGGLVGGTILATADICTPLYVGADIAEECYCKACFNQMVFDGDSNEVELLKMALRLACTRNAKLTGEGPLVSTQTCVEFAEQGFMNEAKEKLEGNDGC